MKKRTCIILLFSLTWLMTSCEVETYTKPPKTLMADQIALATSDQISWSASLARVAHTVQMWKEATTNEERSRIDIKYFGELKILELGDTIQLVGFCKINTFGKSLNESKWEILSQLHYPNWVLEVQKNSDSSYTVGMNSETANSHFRLRVDILSENSHRVTGTGENLSLKNEYQRNVSYRINEALKFNCTTSIASDFYEKIAHEGQLNMKLYQKNVYLEGNDITVSFFPNRRRVTFRGVTEER